MGKLPKKKGLGSAQPFRVPWMDPLELLHPTSIHENLKTPSLSAQEKPYLQSQLHNLFLGVGFSPSPTSRDCPFQEIPIPQLSFGFFGFFVVRHRINLLFAQPGWETRVCVALRVEFSRGKAEFQQERGAAGYRAWIWCPKSRRRCRDPEDLITAGIFYPLSCSTFQAAKDSGRREHPWGCAAPFPSRSRPGLSVWESLESCLDPAHTCQGCCGIFQSLCFPGSSLQEITP